MAKDRLGPMVFGASTTTTATTTTTTTTAIRINLFPFDKAFIKSSQEGVA